MRPASGEFDPSSYLTAGKFDVPQVQQELIDNLGQNGLRVSIYPLDYGLGQIYQFIRAADEIFPADKVVAVGASLHANEIAGFLTWLKRAKEIITYAQERRVKLIVYPLRNPSGLALVEGYPDRDETHRHNIKDDKGSGGKRNSDFMRFELIDGSIKDDLGESREYNRWFWPWEVANVRLPLETDLMCHLVKDIDLKIGVPINGAVDYHQDLITDIADPAFYFYTHEDDSSIYSPLVSEIERLGLRILRNYPIDAGYIPGRTVVSDRQGMVCRWDGSWPNALTETGTRHGVTPETTGATPLDLAVEVNVRTTKFVIDLVANE